MLDHNTVTYQLGLVYLMPHPLMSPTASEISCVFYRAKYQPLYCYENTGLDYIYNTKHEKFFSLFVQISQPSQLQSHNNTAKVT